MLSISTKEFYALVQAGKIHPFTTSGKHIKVPVAEIIALKAELSHRALAMPCEKFIMASAFFASNAVEVNQALSDLGCPRAPVEYIERLRMTARQDSSANLIRAKTLDEFFQAFGRSYELLKREDVRLMVEVLHMISKGEEEIAQAVRAKYGREYTNDEVQRFIEYFWSWKVMDPDSARFYFELIQGRNRTLKECAYKRADYFVYYALGIDYGGEVAELLERSCLGLLYKFNILVDSFVYGTAMVNQQDLQRSAELIQTILGAARDVRDGKTPKDKGKSLADHSLPNAITRGEFFKSEKETAFNAKPQ
jgi:hypothetical protein